MEQTNWSSMPIGKSRNTYRRERRRGSESSVRLGFRAVVGWDGLIPYSNRAPGIHLS